ncbi:MAG TPA: glycine betaine ABC transporter substrate-binding protein [Bryobacteraceae bacterium]|nr:glycine betaine ABC transporter substrate-binding protein [Bryobacteraceae bacterium]
MDRTKIFGLTLALALVLTACGKKQPPIVVGSKNFTEQVVLGEIIAQHLEHRLGHPVVRRFNLGGTLLSYQALLLGEISLYPEYTGTVEAEILKEKPPSDPEEAYLRAKQELDRRVKIDVLKPLGIDDFFAMVVRGEDARKEKVTTLSQAAQAKTPWKLAAGYEFQSRIDGMPALDTYHLPFDGGPRTMDLGLMYKALEQGKVTMIAANATDGPLASHDWVILQDDKKAFGAYQACILLREDMSTAQPQLKPALEELSGKFTNAIMRKLNAEVDTDHRQPAEVAAQFLSEAGLK